MEEIILRFGHIGGEMFELLDNENLLKCQKVSKTWNRFINKQKFTWTRIIKKFDKESNENHVDCLKQWKEVFRKTKVEDVRKFAKGLSTMYQKSDTMRDFENDPSNSKIHDMTALHFACIHGHIQVLDFQKVKAKTLPLK